MDTAVAWIGMKTCAFLKAIGAEAFWYSTCTVWGKENPIMYLDAGYTCILVVFLVLAIITWLW